MQEWVQVIQSLGVPVTILAVMVIGIWKVGRWMGENVIKPMVAAAILTLKTVQEAVISLKEDSERQTVAHVKLVEAHAALVNRLGVKDDGKS